MSIDFAATFGKTLDPQFAALLKDVFRAPVSASGEAQLALEDGTAAPVIGHIPRFVSSDRYVGSFSFQWSHYTTVLHDSLHDSTFSLRDFTEKFDLGPEDVRGRLFLDAGCGTGRVCEILAGWGGYVVGVDLSRSVEVARQHLQPFDNVVVLQGDIGDLPFRPEAFDMVVSTGVLHHTPDTRAYAARLVPLVRPGGEFAIWVYDTRFRRRKQWTPLTSRLPHPAFDQWCNWIVGVASDNRGDPALEMFLRLFPFATHHETAARSALTLFDGYTPTYHGVHSEDEVMEWFRDFGLTDIRTNRIPTSVRGRKPETAADG